MNPTRRFVARQVLLVAAGCATAALAVPAAASAAQHLVASPSLSGRLGASGLLAVDATVTDPLGGIPSPLAQLNIDIPPGLRYQFASTPTCPIATVTAANGSVPPDCPAGSRIGAGTAAVQAALGTTMLNETAQLDIYLTRRAPVQYEVWASGTSPIAETLAFPGTFTRIGGRFAEQISVQVPPIPTVPGGPDASVVGLRFTIGGTHAVRRTRIERRGRRRVRRVVEQTVGLFDLPKTCPGRVLPYAATASFRDGTTASVTGQVSCPATATRSSHATHRQRSRRHARPSRHRSRNH